MKIDNQKLDVMLKKFYKAEPPKVFAKPLVVKKEKSNYSFLLLKAKIIAACFVILFVRASFETSTKLKETERTKYCFIVSPIVWSVNAKSDYEKTQCENFVKAFMEKYHDYDFKVIIDYGKIDLDRIKSNDIGDVFSFDSSLLSIYSGYLMPLDAYLEPLEVDVNNVSKSAFELGYVNNRLFMASQESYSNNAFIINKTALEEAGIKEPDINWTWDDYISNYMPIIKSLKSSWAEPNSIPYAVHPDIFNPLKNRFVDSPIISSRFKYWYKGYGEYNYVIDLVHKDDFEDLARRYEIAGVDWDIVRNPLLTNRSIELSTIGCGVKRTSKQPDTAAAFALFFYTKEGQRAYHSAENFTVPVLLTEINETYWHSMWPGKNYKAFVR